MREEGYGLEDPDAEDKAVRIEQLRDSPEYQSMLKTQMQQDIMRDLGQQAAPAAQSTAAIQQALAAVGQALMALQQPQMPPGTASSCNHRKGQRAPGPVGAGHRPPDGRRDGPRRDRSAPADPGADAMTEQPYRIVVSRGDQYVAVEVAGLPDYDLLAVLIHALGLKLQTGAREIETTADLERLYAG